MTLPTNLCVSFFLNKFTVHLKLIIMKVIINNLIYAKRSEKSFHLSVIVYKFNNVINCVINILLFNCIFCCSFPYIQQRPRRIFYLRQFYRNTDKVSVFELNAGSFVSVVTILLFPLPLGHYIFFGNFTLFFILRIYRNNDCAIRCD